MTRSARMIAGLIVGLILFSTTVFAQSPARIAAENLFVEAQKALSAGDDATAETYLKRALEKDPAFTSAIWQLSQIYEKRGQLEHARELILRGLQQEPNASWARQKLSQLETVLTRKLLGQAEALMSTGEYKKAIPKLSLFMGIKPYDPTPLVLLGRCHLALGNLDSARQYFVQARERDSQSGEISALLTEVERRIEDSSLRSLVSKAQGILSTYSPDKKESARAALDAVLERDPNNAWAVEKMSELDLISIEPEKTETGQRIEKGIEAARKLGGPLSSVRTLLMRHLGLLLAAVATVLLAFDIRKRGRNRSYPLQGSLSLIPILDVVSLLNSNLKSGRLVIRCPKKRGEIFFEKGEIVHARFGADDGKKAFHSQMNLGSGQYYFTNHLPNVRHTITEPLSLLLLSMRSDGRKKPAPSNETPESEKLFLTSEV